MESEGAKSQKNLIMITAVCRRKMGVDFEQRINVQRQGGIKKCIRLPLFLLLGSLNKVRYKGLSPEPEFSRGYPRLFL